MVIIRVLTAIHLKRLPAPTHVLTPNRLVMDVNDVAVSDEVIIRVETRIYIYNTLHHQRRNSQLMDW